MCCWLCRCIKRRRCVAEYQSLHFHLSLVCSLSGDNIIISLIAVRLFGAHHVHRPHWLCYPATLASVHHFITETLTWLIQNNKMVLSKSFNKTNIIQTYEIVTRCYQSDTYYSGMSKCINAEKSFSKNVKFCEFLFEHSSVCFFGHKHIAVKHWYYSWLLGGRWTSLKTRKINDLEQILFVQL